MTLCKIWPFIKKNIVLISAIVSLIGGSVYLIDRFELGSKISNIVLVFINGIINLKIPDFILAILIILIFIFLFLINKKFLGFSPDKIKDIELTENQLFILALIAESNRSGSYSLFNCYKKRFPEAPRIEVKNIANVLVKNGLIRHIGNVGDNLIYVATDKGVERANKEPEIRKKYEKDIEEYREIEEIAKKY